MKFRWLILTMVGLAWGCSPKTMIKPQPQPIAVNIATPTPTPVVAPTLVNVHPVISDQVYQAALTQAGGLGATLSQSNAQDFQIIAQYQYNQGDLADSLKNYQNLVSLSGPQADKAQYMVGQIYYDQKNYLAALAAFQSVISQYPNSPYYPQSYQMTEFVLNNFLDLDDLRSFVNNYSQSPLKCTALFQLGCHEVQAGMQAEAFNHLTNFIQQCPSDAAVSQAQTILQSLQVKVATHKTWRIGVLVPLTGPYSDFGESVLDGVLLAADQAEQSDATHRVIEVVVRDTVGDPATATKVFQGLTADDSLDAIIGPVLPAVYSVIAPLANQAKITMLCPSAPRDGLSTFGPYIFSNSMTNEMQGRAMAKFAIDHLGFKRFGILAPDDSDSNDYGQTLAQSFAQAVTADGGVVAATETYIPGSTDFREQLLALGGQDPELVRKAGNENIRRLAELNYRMGKAIDEIMVRAKDLASAYSDENQAPTPNPTQTATPGTGPALAFMALPEVPLTTDKTEPTITNQVVTTLEADLNTQTAYAVRSNDLVQQSLTLLPTGTPYPTTDEQWSNVAQDIQASLIITAQVYDDESTDPVYGPTWLYGIHLDAYQLNPLTKAMTEIYQTKILYNEIKPMAPPQNVDNIQALFVPGHTPMEIPQIASQVHFYGLNPVLLGGHLWEDELVRQDGGQDVEGAYFVTGFYVDSTQPNIQTFANDFLRRFNKRPGLLAAQSYDAMNMLIQATLMSTTRDDIHTNLLSITNYNGVSGLTTFAGHGEADKLVPILKIQNGQLVQVQ